MSLHSPINGLLATPSSQLPYQANVQLRSYLLERPQGNVVIYNSPGLTSTADEIADRGAVSRLLINHAHESMYGNPSLGMPAFVHARDRTETARGMNVTGVFTTRQNIDDDLEVIPTPGHTAGTTSYLWDNGEHRFLFTGDFIWIENGEWKAVVLIPGLRNEYLTSLSLVRDLDFDVLVPWGATDDGPPIAITTNSEARERIGAIMTRISAGRDR
jgi:glyoxylase-like metal-dependent hydrolase (beta-lactamase superfamily II)